MFNLSFGFFGVQIAYALQSANISRIFATLGADPHQLSFFWILPPLMGMIVQPLIGKWSDRTWCRMGRRKPYLLVGAIVAVLVMVFLPNAGSLNFSQRLFLGLNGAMWFGLFSLIFLDTSINVAMQPFKMMVGDMVNEQQKTQAYSIQSFLCNAGSLVGYLFPIFFTWIGIANTAPKGVIPDSVIWSFYCGAAILILCVLYTFMKVKEMNPKEYAEFHGFDLQAQQEGKKEGFIKLLAQAPKAFWTVGLVQFFCWAAFLFMWTYTNGAIAQNVWGTTDVTSEGYQTAGRQLGGRALRRPGRGLALLGALHPEIQVEPGRLHHLAGDRRRRFHLGLLPARQIPALHLVFPDRFRLGRHARPAVLDPDQCAQGQLAHG